MSLAEKNSRPKPPSTGFRSVLGPKLRDPPEGQDVSWFNQRHEPREPQVLSWPLKGNLLAGSAQACVPVKSGSGTDSRNGHWEQESIGLLVRPIS